MDKEKIKQACLQVVNKKLEDIQVAINNYKTDLNSETKSSAGDKHETGRAMLQLEMEKLGQQYQTVLSQKNLLNKVIIGFSKSVAVGSLVKVNNHYYFLATSIGQLIIDKTKVMVVSVNSPIGKQLLGKKVNDDFVFNQQKFKVQEVI
ncbi:GreA/GreB family elongation factor [Wenyingzhuangia sp. IMCC45533]